MRRFSLPLTVLALVAAVGLSVGPMAAGKAKSDEKLISVDEIQPGMTGHGLTVFEGSDVERFDVQVISVIHDFLPDQDLILARCSHPVLAHAGVIAGMSGSPVYLDGRLAGAVAYAWRFAKDPIAGITPATDMRAYLDLPAMPPGVGTGTAKILPSAGTSPPAAPALPSFFSRFDSESSQMVPLATPVGGHGPLFSTFIKHMQPMMDQHFMIASPPAPASSVSSPAPSTSSGKGEKGKGAAGTAAAAFHPGDPIAVRLVGGDLDMAATGTVTMVKGHRALGFGHPMFNWGAVRFPAARARIHHCLASQMFSFKMSESLEPAGAIVQDRQAGILADGSVDPMTIDLDVQLEDSSRDLAQTWHMDVAHHRQLTPGLIRSALTSAVDHFALEVVDTVVDGHYSIELKDHDPLQFDEKVFLPTGTLSLAYSQRLYDALSALMKSPFEMPRVEKVNVDIGLRYDHDVAVITAAWAEKDEVREGDLVQVWMVIEPHQGTQMTLGFVMEVPPGSAGQTLRVDIKPGGMVPPDYLPPEDLGDVIHNLALGWPSDQAVAVVKSPSGGLIVNGHPIPSLPISALSTLQPEVGDQGQMPLATLDRYFITTPYLLHGTVSFSIQVQKD